MYMLPSLSYTYNALERFVDARTMEIHYTKHHQGYIDKLNDALKDSPEFQGMPIKELLLSLDKLPVAIRTAVKNNGGGHYAHTLFWQSMTDEVLDAPDGELAKAIDSNFSSFASFKKEFSGQAASFFGSGWIWLCVDKANKLVIISLPGHDVPFAQGFEPILVLDVWEHAYYLKYQNRRAEYIEHWWSVVNWENVAKLYQDIIDRR